jgi:cytochrome P450
MGWNDDSWKDGYDAWKLASPDDDLPEEECFHEDYEADINARAICCNCGHVWWMTADEIAAERAHVAAYDEAMRREERRERWRELRRWFRSFLPKRRRQRFNLDDEIPF